MAPLWTALPETTGCADSGLEFPSPFDELGPSPLARLAAGILQAELRTQLLAAGLKPSLLDVAGGGKMFGVLVVEAADGRLGFLRAFSGAIDGRFDLPGFVPPIFDREARLAIEVPGERVVKQLTSRAESFAASAPIAAARDEFDAITSRQREELARLGERHSLRRSERRAMRLELDGQGDAEAHRARLHELAQQSRRDKAERRQAERVHGTERAAVEAELARLQRRLAAHARLHRMVSRRLMHAIHDTYRVANWRGEVRALRDLYAPSEPPGGAGDCAAPKLLAYAFEQRLRPVALAEFWWGAPPPTGGRVSGAFYPACREKCGPLLPFMLEGMRVAPPRCFTLPRAEGLDLRVVFEDDWIVVVDKPCGLLSVPARSGSGDCVITRLQQRFGADTLLVHRLDLDTSGLLVAARDRSTYVALQRQFLKRTVEKRYVAILERPPDGAGGVIELPIRVDVHDRPRQIHDAVHGRPAVTEWRAAGRRVVFFPRTGRTHQIRVHAAHPLGLAAAIVGDRLYGHAGERLLLHAEAIAFTHPASGRRVAFESPAPF